MSAIDNLLDYIFDGATPAFHREFEGWVRGSRRFQQFTVEYRSKIRAKLRNAPDAERLLDVRAELQAAALLLQNRQFALEYERYAALKQRGPDFTVTYKTHTPFNVEVRRLPEGVGDAAESLPPIAKLTAVLVEKVRQMPPSIVNLLWLSGDAEISEAELGDVALSLQQLADRKEEAFFTGRGFPSAADFLKQYQRLSGVVLPHSGEFAVWLNPTARHKALPNVVRAIIQLEPL